MSMLEKMRQRHKSNNNTDDSVYPFWNIPRNKSSVVRFLPWEDPVTGNIYTEKKIINLAFVDNNDDDKLVYFRVPTLEMYDPNERCRVTDVVRGLYKEADELKEAGKIRESEDLVKVASKHWIKPVFYYQGFVQKSGFTEETVPENPIRRFPLKKQLHKIIMDSILDEEINPFKKLPTGEFTKEDVDMLFQEDAEFDEEFLDRFRGYDFVIKKTASGEYDSYTSSSWIRDETKDLTDEQLEAIHQYGFHDLRKALPERPTDEQYDVMVEMIQKSVDRLRGFDEGVWNPEWEEIGLKPFRPKAGSNNRPSSAGSDDEQEEDEPKKTTSSGSKSSGKTQSASAIKDRLKSRKKQEPESEEAESEPEENAEPEAEAEDQSEPEQEEVKETKSSGGSEDVAARIKARINQSKQKKSA